jgi:hypothetical protein
LRDSEWCVFHDPDYTGVVQAARSAGGRRRREEASVATEFDIIGLIDSFEDLKRLLEIAAVDALRLPNSVPRTRLLVAIVQAGASLLERGDVSERLEILEDALRPRVARLK